MSLKMVSSIRVLSVNLYSDTVKSQNTHGGLLILCFVMVKNQKSKLTTFVTMSQLKTHSKLTSQMSGTNLARSRSALLKS
jgi:hypothetical protein